MEKLTPEFVDAFCTAWGAKQVGVIVHGGGIEPAAFAAAEEAKGLVAVELPGHTRIYAFNTK